MITTQNEARPVRQEKAQAGSASFDIRDAAAHCGEGLSVLSRPAAQPSGQSDRAAECRDVSPRSLLYFYLSALVALLLSVFASMALTELEVAHLKRDSAALSDFGEQQVLSQRILHLAESLVAQQAGTDPAQAARTAATLAVALDAFEAATALMEERHTAFGAGSVATERLTEALFAGPPGTSLSDRLATYADLGRAILENPADSALLADLRTIERGGLLADLDRVTAIFQAASVARASFLRDIERYILVFAVFVVAIEVAFVFLPGHRAIVRRIDAVNDRNRALTGARVLLQHENRELVARNDAVNRTRDDLAVALTESERMRAEQSEFTYAVSHDLKSPANTINLLLEELRIDHYDALGAEGQQMLEAARGTVRRMSDLIEDVLVFSWVTEEGARPEEFDVGDCLRDVLTDLSSEIREAEARISVGNGLMVTGYHTQIRVLVQNLVSNAIKFRASGTAPQIGIRCLPVDERGTWRLVVEDNGIGIPQEHQARIFKMFERLHVRDAYPGSGLGLATCQRIVANHQGKTVLVSAPGEGTTFDITLKVPAACASPTRGIAPDAGLRVLAAPVAAATGGPTAGPGIRAA